MSPFDPAHYESLLKGLEITELLLSEVARESTKLRLDSGYFAKPMLAADAQIRRYPNGYDELGRLFSRFVKGVFDISADTYARAGVPFLRILNLKDGLIDESNLVLIPQETHQKEIKTELRRGDVVLSKTAYPAASLVTLSRCNTSQDTIATTLSPYGAATYRPEAIVAYLNSAVGQRLLWRQFQGNVQLHLSLDDGRKVPVPKLGGELQELLARTVQKAEAALVSSREEMAAAEAEVLEDCGLRTWQAPQALAYECSSSVVLTAKRIDAEYFHPAKGAALAALKERSGQTVGELCTSVRDVWNPDDDSGPPLVRNYDLADALVPFLDRNKALIDKTTISSVKKKIIPGDLVVSRLRSYLKEIAVVPSRLEGLTVASTEFIVLRPKDSEGVPVEALLLYLRSALPQVVLKWSQDGSNHPRFDEKELLRLPVPRAVIQEANKYAAAVGAIIRSRERAKELLSAAKRAVGIAIERTEEAACEYLNCVIHEEETRLHQKPKHLRNESTTEE